MAIESDKRPTIEGGLFLNALTILRPLRGKLKDAAVITWRYLIRQCQPGDHYLLESLEENIGHRLEGLRNSKPPTN